MHIHLTNYFASFFRRATSLAYARLVVFPTQHSVWQIADRVSWAGPFALGIFFVILHFFSICVLSSVSFSISLVSFSFIKISLKYF